MGTDSALTSAGRYSRTHGSAGCSGARRRPRCRRCRPRTGQIWLSFKTSPSTVASGSSTLSSPRCCRPGTGPDAPCSGPGSTRPTGARRVQLCASPAGLGAAAVGGEEVPQLPGQVDEHPHRHRPRAEQAARSPTESWYVNADVLGFDCYVPASVPRAMAYARAKHKPWAIPEFGADNGAVPATSSTSRSTMQPVGCVPAGRRVLVQQHSRGQLLAAVDRPAADRGVPEGAGSRRLTSAVHSTKPGGPPARLRAVRTSCCLTSAVGEVQGWSRKPVRHGRLARCAPSSWKSSARRRGSRTFRRSGTRLPKAKVVVKVEASGLCRSDWHGWMGHDPDIQLPHVPGHELAGTIAAVGAAG